MRKKVHFLSILFTVGLMLSVFTNKVWGERLVKYLSAEDGTIFYYDIDSMKKSSGKIKVWETIKYSDDSEIKNRMIKLRKDFKKCNGCEKLSESKILYEINCREDIYLIIQTVDLDSDRRLLDSIVHSSKEWENVIPTSNREILIKEVCK